jgi:hypothetical protein
MKKLLLLLLIAYSLSAIAENAKGGKCEASINGQPIHTVYIFGDQYNGVVWAYKHLGEATCLTPTTDLSKADAILEIHRIWTPGQDPNPDPTTISCTSREHTTTCTDSNGNELVTSCSPDGCTSYYGPSLLKSIATAFNSWISTRWYEADARLYTVDHKLLWKSESQKGDWKGALWPDKVRLGTNSPICTIGYWSRPKYKNYRHWASTECKVEFDPLVSIDITIKGQQSDTQKAQ